MGTWFYRNGASRCHLGAAYWPVWLMRSDLSLPLVPIMSDPSASSLSFSSDRSDFNSLCWNYSFQNHTEQWRAASLRTACVPVFLFINIGYSMWLVDMDSGHGLIMIIIAIISSLIYIAARITLIILMMLSLRSLPPGVYDTVDWTRFVPHF
ncbi:uncharacterized protein BJ212DRAFT_1364586 [Suillus subaureus]|uniref:Uncharacterized protein n=1 Tax=Suillus subaureus TaxID=48587 RepID=A0A9P7E837_9AGAM|nr:uncharacterized protein BJ212DRAFT_1364586 [Suillus subaureus]KAG1813930.1 hypothetical protein BJ212DRAFT_1364586 [Suillus subaureus]